MRSFLFTTASVFALSLGAAVLFRRREARARVEDGMRRVADATNNHLARYRLDSEAGERHWKDARTGQVDVATVTRDFLMFFVLPLWITSGVADYLCHRATDIEHTTGSYESLLHLAMLVEMGVPTLAALLLEINSPVLALMVASFVLHEATALWDVSYAVGHRNVTPLEQHVHSFLEMLPLMALSFIAVLHWPEVMAMVGAGDRPADWSLRLKEDPLPTGYVVATLAAVVLFNALPYLEELWQDIRANGLLLTPEPQPYRQLEPHYPQREMAGA
ncbi:MAG TPA: hypothetical protein VD978_28995 [Azospirillum sp.]|nr:hypothetical protein [Azospirillum sp.]